MPSASTPEVSGVAVRLGLRSAVVLAVASVAGLMMLCWPLLLRAESGERVDPPFFFLFLLPLVIMVVLSEISEGGMDARVLAILGVLTAVNAFARVLGAGTSGIELSFFLLILGGRVFGAGFGFALGCTSFFASALLTAGIGPWLPFQMMCAAWVGMFAGLLPRRWRGQVVSGRWEILLLVIYACVASYAYGLLMNLSFWPFTLGIDVAGHEGSLSYAAGAPVSDNLHRFLVFTLLTSTGGWDTGRAIVTSVALVMLGPAILVTLRRAARKALVLPSPST